MAEEEQSTALKNTVTIEDAGPCKKKVTIEIPEETIKKATDEQYETLRKEVVVPGFRKGRAPRRLLEKRFGKETSEQIKLKLLADASEAVVKNDKLDILGEPDTNFEDIELPESGPLKFGFEVEVRPEFELPPLEGIPVTKTALEVTDDQIDREIRHVQRLAGVWAPREKGAVELEDRIIADVVLNIRQGDKEEEENLNNIDIHVRKGGFVGAIPVEKLDELLAGANPGDTKKTTIEVPKTYFREQYRGKEIDVEITIKEVKYLKSAELDENFLSRCEVEDENELRERIRDTLQSRIERQGRTEMTEQIYKYLLDNTTFDLPLDIVAEQADTLLRRQYSALLMRDLPKDQIEEQMEQLHASSEEQAKQQLKTFFIMDKVAEKLDIEITEEEINGHIAQLAIQRRQRPQQMREEMERDGSLTQFRLQVREDKCISRMLESAEIVEKKPKKTKAKTTKKATKKAEEESGETSKKTTKKRKSATSKTKEA